MRTKPLVIVCGLLALGTAAAAPTASERAKAKREYQAAQKQYDLGNFKEALTGFSEAYRLDPRPPFLFNIGQCHRMLGEHERALFFFDRFLSFYPPGKAPNDKLVHELIAEEDAKLKGAKAAAAAASESPKAESPPAVPPALTPAPFPAEAEATVPAPPLVPSPGPDATAESSGGITKTWWFWTAVGVVAAGAVAAGAVAVARPQPRSTTLPDGDFR